MSELINRSRVRQPTATAQEVSAETAPFPVKTADMPNESFFDDWRARLSRNLSRRSDSRWEPLTWVHAGVEPAGQPETPP